MGFLQPIPDPPTLFHTFTIDFVTSLPEEKGFDSVAVAVEKKSKYVVVWPTSTTRTKEQRADEFFRKVICRFGVACKLISDRDPSTTNADYEAILKKWGCEQALTTSYRAAADGQSERMIKDLRVYFRIYLTNDKSWLDLLETFEFSHNIATSDTTGYSPFELVYGQQARTMTDLVPDQEIPSESMRQIAEKRATQFRLAQENVRKAQQKQAQQYNKHRKEVDIKVGDFVLVAHKALLDLSERDKPINKAKALLAGPFRVVKETSYSTRRILLPLGCKAHDVINVDKLWRYNPSPDKFATRPAPVERSVDLDGEPLYTVENIIDHKLVKSKLTELKVKWLNYPLSEASWVPVHSLRESVPLLVAEYIGLHPECADKPSVTRQAAGDQPAKPAEPAKPAKPDKRKRGAAAATAVVADPEPRKSDSHPERSKRKRKPRHSAQ